MAVQLFILSQVEINCREVSCLVHRDRWASATHVTPPTTCARRPSFNFMRSWARTAATRSRRKIFYCLYFFFYLIVWDPVTGYCGFILFYERLADVCCYLLFALKKGMVQLEMRLHLIYCLLKYFICSFLPTQL